MNYIAMILSDYEEFKNIMKNDNLSEEEIIDLFFKEYCNYNDKEAIKKAKEILSKGGE